jgi:hypothetical protein
LIKIELDYYKQAERIRKLISKNWKNAVQSSGALVYEKPKFENIFEGSVWKICYDLYKLEEVKNNNKTINSFFNFSLDSPYLNFDFEFLNQKNLKRTDDLDLIIINLKTLITEALGNYDILKNTRNKYEEIYEQIEKIISQGDETLLEKNKSNLKKVSVGKKLIEGIEAIVEEIKTCYEASYKNIINEPKASQEYYKIAKMARENVSNKNHIHLFGVFFTCI